MNMDQRTNLVTKALNRRVQGIFPSREQAVEVLSSDKKLTIYMGIDPTGTEMHLGHTIPMLLLADLAEAGHDIVLLIGDFTARIGDPTGKGSARIALSAEDVQRNMVTYLDQATKVIPRNSFRVAYNSEWLGAMTMEEVLRLTSMVTVQQMLARDMFQERLKKEEPIHLSEFLYPLMQGYDSVALRTDVEVGGNDQTFNMLVGRELEKELLGKDKLVLATRLLIDTTTGKKMSKSEGSLISLNDSPQEIRRKILALDDSLTATVFALCTRKDIEWIQEQSEDPRIFKEELAAELIRMYHGDSAVDQAAVAAEIEATGPLVQVLEASGLAGSVSAAKRLVDQKGVLVNGEVAERWDIEIKSGDELRVGKGKFVKVK